MSLEVIDDTILKVRHQDGKQIVYLAKRTQTPIYEVPENLPLAQGAHIRFTVKRSVLGYKFIGINEHTPKPPQEQPRALETAAEPDRARAAPEVAVQVATLPIEQLSGTVAGLGRLGEDPELEELAESARVHGILQPVIAMLSPGTKSVYLVVAGNRRVKAAQKAGLTHIPAIIRPYSLEEAYEYSLIENIQRRDLSGYEKGRILNLMLNKFPRRYPNQEALANILGKSASWISLQIAAYEEAEKLKGKGEVYHGKLEELPERAARELRRIPEEERGTILKELSAISPGPHEKKLSTGRIAEKAGPAPIDTGELWICPTCEEKYRLIHVRPGKHKLVPEVGEGAD